MPDAVPGDAPAPAADDPLVDGTARRPLPPRRALRQSPAIDPLDDRPPSQRLRPRRVPNIAAISTEDFDLPRVLAYLAGVARRSYCSLLNVLDDFALPNLGTD